MGPGKGLIGVQWRTRVPVGVEEVRQSLFMDLGDCIPGKGGGGGGGEVIKYVLSQFSDVEYDEFTVTVSRSENYCYGKTRINRFG